MLPLQAIKSLENELKNLKNQLENENKITGDEQKRYERLIQTLEAQNKAISQENEKLQKEIKTQSKSTIETVNHYVSIVNKNRTTSALLAAALVLSVTYQALPTIYQYFYPSTFTRL